MTAPLTQDLINQLQGAPMNRIGQQLGLDPSQASTAVSAALPLLMGALGKNTNQQQGAGDLFSALQRDHAGQDLSNVLGAVLGGGGQGGDILGHIFGNRQQGAAQGLGAATGLDNDRAGSLLKLLAPIVMAYLAKRLFSQQSAATPATSMQSTPQGLGELLGQEQQQIRQSGGLGGGLLGAVLDQDGDGDLDVSDLMKLGGSIFGGR
jgi:hypothetical protein